MITLTYRGLFNDLNLEQKCQINNQCVEILHNNEIVFRECYTGTTSLIFVTRLAFHCCEMNLFYNDNVQKESIIKESLEPRHAEMV